MNQAQTIAAIRALPDISVSINDGEYRVTFATLAIRAVNLKAGLPLSFGFVQERAEAVACYTSDASDALGTAMAMQAAGYQVA